MVCRSDASLLSGYYNGCYSWQILEFNYERCRECEIYSVNSAGCNKNINASYSLAA